MCFCPEQLWAAWISQPVIALWMLPAIWLSQKGAGVSPLSVLWLTLDHPFWVASHHLAHGTVHCPSNAVIWKSPSPPAYKHKLRKRLQQERPFAPVPAVKATVQIPAHFLLRVTAEQELQFLVLGGIRWLFFCGVRNTTLEYPFQDTQIRHNKQFGISKRNTKRGFEMSNTKKWCFAFSGGKKPSSAPLATDYIFKGLFIDLPPKRES